MHSKLHSAVDYTSCFFWSFVRLTALVVHVCYTCTYTHIIMLLPCALQITAKQWGRVLPQDAHKHHPRADSGLHLDFDTAAKISALPVMPPRGCCINSWSVSFLISQHKVPTDITQLWLHCTLKFILYFIVTYNF